jgi:FAD:protein FMN transferase
MSTFVSVSVPAVEAGALKSYVEPTRRIMSELAASLTIYSPDSEISRLNRAAGSPAPAALSPHATAVLAASRHYGEISGGAFDVTVGPVLRLWGFAGAPPRTTLPTGEEIAQARARTGWASLVVSNATARLEKKEMYVDLGGIAKGYAVDVCCDELRGRGAANFMVNLAGNLRCYGQGRPGRAWTIAVRNPFDSQRHLGTIQLTGGMATASSGNYERFVEIEGKRYAHIIDPRSGLPVKGMAGTTVICSTATEADAMSTTVFILGPEGSEPLLRSLHCEALFVLDARPVRILVTPGFRRQFEPAAEFATPGFRRQFEPAAEFASHVEVLN